MEATDEELVSSCQSGSLAAFNALYERYHDAIFRFCYRMVGNADDADDIAQDVFVRAHRGLPRFRGDCRFTTWLYRIATNLCIERRRSARPAPLPLDAPGVQEMLCVPMPGSDPVAVAERRFTEEAIAATIRELPAHHRAVVVLRDVEGLSYDEMAHALGCSVAAVKVRLHRARELLRKRLRSLLLEDV